jgi:hypothetical protein
MNLLDEEGRMVFVRPLRAFARLRETPPATNYWWWATPRCASR